MRNKFYYILMFIFSLLVLTESTAYLFGILKPAAILYEEDYYSKIQKCIDLARLETDPQLISINSPRLPNVQKDLLKPTDDFINFDQFKSVEIQNPQEEIACLVLTSGSTGVPKIVQLTHALMMHGACIWWDNKDNYAPMNKDSVVFSFSPLRWISQIQVLMQSMLFGLKRISSCGAPTGKYGLGVLSACDITHIFVAPSIFYEILLQVDDDDTHSLSSLKFVQLGGEPCSKIILEKTQKHVINGKAFQCYGMTEVSTCISNDEHINGGKPLPGYEMQILDDNMNPLGPNQRGQIALKPPFPLKGYMAVDNAPYYNKQGLFVNGDYGLIDDQHQLHVLARYKDLIKSHGETVS